MGRIAMPDSNVTDSTFDDVFTAVQRNRDVCGNCFRRTHHTFERNYAVDIIQTDDFEWETWTRKVELPPRSWPVKRNRSPVPRSLPSGGIRYNCNCGYPPGEQLRPVPKKLFFSYAENLIQRYKEFGVPVDVETFFRTLRDLKTDPSEQFADDRLYRKATESALEAVDLTDRNDGKAEVRG